MAELENIDDECDGRGIYFVKIDNYEEAKEYGIDSIPTLVYFESEIPYIFEGESCVSSCAYAMKTCVQETILKCKSIDVHTADGTLQLLA